MDETLPVRDKRHIAGEQALRLLERTLPKPWIVRRQEADYGVDVEVELAGSHASGRIFKGQVRGHASITWTKDETFLQPVQRSTLTYWTMMPVPMILFCVDLAAEKVYWSPGTGATSESGGVRVRRSSVLPETMSELLLHVFTWVNERELLYELPSLLRRWERSRDLEGLDPWMPLDDDQLEDISYVYRQTIRLRLAMGLPYADVIPWGLWVARSRRTWGDDNDLFYGTLDELLIYLRPIFEEAMKEAKRRLNMEDPSPENSKARALATGYEIVWACSGGFENEGSDFWKGMDKDLERMKALKFPASQARPRR